MYLFKSVFLFSLLTSAITQANPLHEAIKQHRNFIELLKENPTWINETDENGKTPLMLLASDPSLYDRSSFISLLSHHADTRVKDSEGNNAIMLAAKNQNYEFVASAARRKEFLEIIDAVNNNSENALLLAVSAPISDLSKGETVVRIVVDLLGAAINYHQRNKAHKTFLDLAKDNRLDSLTYSKETIYRWYLIQTNQMLNKILGREVKLPGVPEADGTYEIVFPKI